jgi:hypothetical protein
MQPQKLAPTTEVRCGLQKYSTFSEKRAKTLTIFFLYFPKFFWQFWWNQTGEAIYCWAWVIVARWTYADRRICGAMGSHTIWRQGLAINECRFASVHPGPKYKSQLRAKTCRDVAQQGQSKGRWKEHTEQVNNIDFSFFLNFSLIFPKGTSRNQTFLFFSLFFYNFLWTRIKKDATKKMGPTTEVGCGLQKYSMFSEKRAKTLKIFFHYFLDFFW